MCLCDVEDGVMMEVKGRKWGVEEGGKKRMMEEKNKEESSVMVILCV